VGAEVDLRVMGRIGWGREEGGGRISWGSRGVEFGAGSSERARPGGWESAVILQSRSKHIYIYHRASLRGIHPSHYPAQKTVKSLFFLRSIQEKKKEKEEKEKEKEEKEQEEKEKEEEEKEKKKRERQTGGCDCVRGLDSERYVSCLLPLFR